MTAAFEKFLQQYKMKDIEKADGYSSDVFTGLSESEKQEVFDLLLTEISVSAKWLFLLAPEKAWTVVKKQEAEWRGDPYRRVFNLQEELLLHTGDLEYQDHMIDDYHHYRDDLKPLAIDALGRTPYTKKKIQFLKDIILTETNDDAVFRASIRLLASLKIQRNTQQQEENYKELLNYLNSNETDKKLEAFSKLKYYEELH